MKKYVTVVFEINDGDSFRSEFDKFHQKMLVDKSEPWRVTAMSLDDEMHRLSLIEECLEKDDAVSVCNEIIMTSDIWRKTAGDFSS